MTQGEKNQQRADTIKELLGIGKPDYWEGILRTVILLLNIAAVVFITYGLALAFYPFAK